MTRPILRLRRALLTGALLTAAPLAAQTAPAAEGPSPARPDSATRDLGVLRAAQQARRHGAATAPVLLYEFFDYACPDCGRFARTRADSIEARFVATGAVERIAAPFPIPRLLRSWTATEGALCAGAVGGATAFARVHRDLLHRQREWSVLADARPLVRAIVSASGVDLSAWQRCLDDDLMVSLLLTDQRVAAAVGVQGTPTLVLLPRSSDAQVTPIRLDGFAPLDSIARAVARLSGRETP